MSLAVVCTVPFFVGNYPIYVLTLAAIYSMVVTGLTLFMGYTGQLSIGHAAFYGIGGYTSALLTKAGVPFLLAILLAGAASASFGYLVGLAALRLRGFYLAMATLAFGLIVFQVMKNVEGPTGGASGMTQIPPASIGGYQFVQPIPYFFLALAFLLLTLAISAALVSSPTGRALRAIASNELAAQALGINSYRLKIISFALSAAYAGMAGALYTHLIRFISPDDFTFHFSVLFLTMAVVGGLGSTWGGLIGATTLTVIAEQLRAFARVEPILFGAALILLVIFLPNGVVTLFGWRLPWQRPAREKALEASAPDSAETVGPG